MKKTIMTVACAIALALGMTSCSAIGMVGSVYTDFTVPTAVTSNALGTKVGQAEAISVLGVVAIGDALGLPYELTHKTPSDGLCGKTDEDNLGFTYEVLNKYIRTGVCEDEKVKNRIDALHRKNLFKLQPIPSFEYQGGNYEI